MKSKTVVLFVKSWLTPSKTESVQYIAKITELASIALEGITGICQDVTTFELARCGLHYSTADLSIIIEWFSQENKR